MFEHKKQIYTSRQDPWASRTVPPPIVPISIEGIVQEIYKSRPLASITVMQFELPTVCAGS
jgi:hypothetical protein